MSFLKFAPAVCVVGDEFEIIVATEKNGIIGISINGKAYYEENSGVLPSEKNYAKIRVPQVALDRAKHYYVTFKEAINRKGYFSEIGEVLWGKFAFKPFKKTADIHVYHIADVHFNYEVALNTANYFGEDTDLFVFNGDLGEVETIEGYMEALKFVGDVAGGCVPVIFTRGNHDARGKLAEKYTDFFPANGKKTYYKFSLGCLEGVVLDCGEDKNDDHTDYNYKNPHVYNGVNVFADFRRRELEWLKTIDLDKDKIRISINHICPVMTTRKKGDCFDIERECYGLWNAELERMGIDFMLCGHYHDTWILDKDNELNIIPHEYPVIIGSKLYKMKVVNNKASVEKFYGAAITINPDKVDVSFTDQNHEILQSHTLKLGKKKK